MQDGGGQGQLSHYKVLEMVQNMKSPEPVRRGLKIEENSRIIILYVRKSDI